MGDWPEELAWTCTINETLVHQQRGQVNNIYFNICTHIVDGNECRSCCLCYLSPNSYGRARAAKFCALIWSCQMLQMDIERIQETVDNYRVCVININPMCREPQHHTGCLTILDMMSMFTFFVAFNDRNCTKCNAWRAYYELLWYISIRYVFSIYETLWNNCISVVDRYIYSCPTNDIFRHLEKPGWCPTFSTPWNQETAKLIIFMSHDDHSGCPGWDECRHDEAKNKDIPSGYDWHSHGKSMKIPYKWRF